MSSPSFHNLHVNDQRSALPAVLPPAATAEIKESLAKACQHAMQTLQSIQPDTLDSVLWRSPVELTTWVPPAVSEEIIFDKMDPDMIFLHHKQMTTPHHANGDHCEEIMAIDRNMDKNHPTPPDHAPPTLSPLSCPPGALRTTDAVLHPTPSEEESASTGDAVGMGGFAGAGMSSPPRRSRGHSLDVDIPQDPESRRMRLLLLQKNTAEVHLELAILEAGRG